MWDDAELAATVGAGRVKIDYISGNLGRAAADGRRNHLVVAGPGGGKTHALEAIAAGVRHRLPSALVLRPDLFGVGNYADLLYEALRIHDPGLVDHCQRAAWNWVAFENLLSDAAAAQPTVLVLDDVDRAFSRMEPTAHSRLRNWMERTRNGALLASAAMTRNPASRSRRPWPWLSMFDIAVLPSLEVKDAADLVSAEALRADGNGPGVKRGPSWRPEQIAELHALLGGNPRVWAVIAAHLTRTDSIDLPLSAIFDQLAPYYVPRLYTLSPLSSRLLVELARAGNPLTVTALAERVDLSHQNTAAALSRLVLTNWLIRLRPPAGADQRNSLYAIAESSMREFIRDRDTRHRWS
ncbi:hypothetical protein A5761_10090 [Mycolicibacterium setense]|uniref:MarR family transcriptional regulator n=1 Tax=Mycolicibacterium setense TaxID=431269 RepID=UPI0007EB6E2D|nr:MarR family transcriptional regulator [Mycolicibacterium setense]OBB17693.1 hypothetical protein A5761_10090 [Mycolicibacterium setense]